MIGVRKFRTREGRRKERLRISVKVLLCVLVLTTGVVGVRLALGLEQLRIGEIVVETDGTLEPMSVSSEIREVVSGTLLGLVPRDSLLTFRLRTIEEFVLDTYPRVKHVVTERNGARDLHVRLVERTPSALWCGDVVPPIAYIGKGDAERTSPLEWGSCTLMDDTGYLYAEAPTYSDTALPRYYGPLAQASPIDQSFVEVDTFKDFQQLFADMKSDEHPLAAVLFVTANDIELYLVEGIRVLASAREKPSVLRRNLVALLNSDNVDEDRAVAYIDIRFSPKFYIKYASSTAPEGAGPERSPLNE